VKGGGGLWEFELDRIGSEPCSVMGFSIGGFEVCSYLKVTWQVKFFIALQNKKTTAWHFFSLETTAKSGSILG
jgi:hypothetical protein